MEPRLVLAGLLWMCLAAEADDLAFRYAQIGGETMAFAGLCPGMSVDTKALALWGASHGLSEACAAAAKSYGPDGDMAKGILIWRP